MIFWVFHQLILKLILVSEKQKMLIIVIKWYSFNIHAWFEDVICAIVLEKVTQLIYNHINLDRDK